MKYKYQLIIVGSDVPEKEKVIQSFFVKLKELGLPESIIKVIDSNNIQYEYIGNQPAFAVYFGDKDGIHKDLSIIDKLMYIFKLMFTTRA